MPLADRQLGTARSGALRPAAVFGAVGGMEAERLQGEPQPRRRARARSRRVSRRRGEIRSHPPSRFTRHQRLRLDLSPCVVRVHHRRELRMEAWPGRADRGDPPLSGRRRPQDWLPTRLIRRATLQRAIAESGSRGDVGDVRLVSGGRGGSGSRARTFAVMTKNTPAGCVAGRVPSASLARTPFEAWPPPPDSAPSVSDRC